MPALVCPETKLPVRLERIEDVEPRVSAGRPWTSRTAGPVPAVGRTAEVLLRADDACAYPVVDGIPVLLAPERLVPPDARPPAVDWADPRYAEAYAEMAYYNAVARDEASSVEDSDVLERLVNVLALPPEERSRFPEPASRWLDATYEPAAQWDAFRHLAPLTGTRVLQLGGRGVAAATFLAAGATEATLVTPMYEEAAFGVTLATKLGLDHALTAVVGVAEELPFPDAGFDRVYAGGTLHHTVTGLVAREVRRVLRPGGRFAAVEPWRAPLYDLGIRIFGKREKVPCRPMTAERAEPILTGLDAAEVVHHGTLTRYPLLAAAKLGLELSLPTVWRITQVDDRLCSIVPALRRRGSSGVLLGERIDGSAA